MNKNELITISLTILSLTFGVTIWKLPTKKQPQKTKKTTQTTKTKPSLPENKTMTMSMFPGKSMIPDVKETKK